MHLNKTIPRLLLLSLILSVFAACDSSNVYKHYETLKNHEWKRDHAIEFDVDIEDTATHYDVFLAIRHTSYYPYANLLVNITNYDPDDNMRSLDFEFLLRNSSGSFKAEGAGDIWDIDFLIYEDISYPKAGTYKYVVSNYMPYVSTPDIMEVGLIVKKTDFEKNEEE